MATQAPAWTSLAYRIANDASTQGPPATRLLLTLPTLLSNGASPLEIARKTASAPDSIESLLNELSSYRIVESQPSTLPYASMYYLSSEGVQFFNHVQALLSSSTSSVNTSRGVTR